MNDLSLTTPRKDLEQALMNESDPSKVKDIVNLFNVNIQKQSVIRAGKLSDLQDKLLTQLEVRIDKTPDNMTLQDITQTLKVLTDAQAKQSTIDTENVPQIQINNAVQIQSMTLDRDSRERVLAAVQNILKGNNSDAE